jgi:hypothetical protein
MMFDDQEFILDNFLPRNHPRVIKWVNAEIGSVLAPHPEGKFREFRIAEELDNKEPFVHEWLDANITADLARSFTETLIFVYDETLPAELLMYIHTWFHRQCCDITNIIFLTTHTRGLSHWYNQYLQVHGHRGFRVVEATWLSVLFWDVSRLNTITPAPADIHQRTFHNYFSFYGGTRSSLEQDLLAAMACTRKHLAHIEYMGQFQTDPNKFYGYIEQNTYFKNQAVVNQLIEIKNTVKLPIAANSRRFDTFDYQSVQWGIDQHSVCQVLRETCTDSQFSILTEKTLRAFLHWQIPLPLSGVGTVDLLENLGFEFCHDLIDYSYQYQPVYYDRIHGALQQIDRLAQQYTLTEMQDVFAKYQRIFEHNYNHIVSGTVFRHIRQNTLRELNL